MRKYFLLHMNNSTANKIYKIFSTVVHIVLRNGSNNGVIHRSLKYWTQNFKTLWKMWKYKMKLSTWQKTNLKTDRKTITDNLILLKWYTAFNELIIKNTLVKIKTTFVLMERFHLPQRQISLPKVFWKEGVLSNFEKFTGKHLCQSFFLNKVAGFSLWKERFWHKRFHVNFVKFLRTSFLHRTPLRDSFCHYETAKPFTTKYLSH